MAVDLTDKETWLTLTQAADRLDVHPTTLRRWADNGDLPVMRTPGGHRRFAASEVKRFAERRHTRRADSVNEDVEQVWAEQALSQTRQEITTQDQAWLESFDSDERQRHRELGRKLLGLTLQYVSAPEENENILREARLAGQAYGKMAQQTGLPLQAALKAALFFRDTLVEVALQLPESTRISPEANVRLMRRINRLLNTVHLAIAERYDAIEASRD